MTARWHISSVDYTHGKITRIYLITNATKSMLTTTNSLAVAAGLPPLKEACSHTKEYLDILNERSCNDKHVAFLGIIGIQLIKHFHSMHPAYDLYFNAAAATPHIIAFKDQLEAFSRESINES